MDLRQPEGESSVALFLVADGMGGHSAGNVASQMAVERIMESFYTPTEAAPSEQLKHSIEQANRAIYEAAQSNQEYFRMGTTIVGAAISKDRADIANVGDSRAYLVRGEHIEQVTRDHSWVALQVEMGELTPEEAQQSSNRSVLLRCLGEKLEVLVDLLRLKLQQGDILVLCTDGLHGLVSAEEIRDVVVAQPPQDACNELVKLANARGGHDNITVQVVRIDSCTSTEDGVTAAEATAAQPNSGTATQPTSPTSHSASTIPSAVVSRQLADPPPWAALCGAYLAGMLTMLLVMAGMGWRPMGQNVPIHADHTADPRVVHNTPRPSISAAVATLPDAETGMLITRRSLPLRSLVVDGSYLYWLEGDEPTQWMRFPLQPSQDVATVEATVVSTSSKRSYALSKNGDGFLWADGNGITSFSAEGQASPTFTIPTTTPVRALSATSNAIYWSETGGNQIWSSPLETPGRRFVVNLTHPVVALITRPGDGSLYWAEEGTGIGGTNMQRPVVKASPSYLTADSAHLYWIENSRDGDPDAQLRKCGFDGTGLETVATLKGPVVAVAANEQDLFWVVSESSSYSIRRLTLQR